MNNHGVTQMRLSVSVVLLDYDDVRQAAEGILVQPDLPLDAATQAALPARFFELQKDLKNQAHALEEAAGKRDDRAMAAAYARLSETCVACHAAYVGGKK
jgi:hypothetical protein